MKRLIRLRYFSIYLTWKNKKKMAEFLKKCFQDRCVHTPKTDMHCFMQWTKSVYFMLNDLKIRYMINRTTGYCILINDEPHLSYDQFGLVPYHLLNVSKDNIRYIIIYRFLYIIIFTGHIYVPIQFGKE